MTDEDKAELAAGIAEVISDWSGHDAGRLARMITDRIGPLLRQQGWMPPGTSGKVLDWSLRTGRIPEHHVNRDVLNSHLAELAAILS